jgi:glutamyl-Q tRNA(Asp) synthetase
MAKMANGRWLLRIEDIDLPRQVPGAADDIIATLEMLGFQWDGEIVYQSRRIECYRKALYSLLEKGLAYPCGCTRAEILRIASAPAPGDDGLIYPGICREGLPGGKTERAYRVKVYDELISFDDGVTGHFAQTLSSSCGDFVVQRADGPFAYHLAVVVDDHDGGVTQVVRGADLLTSTPRQIYLQKLLGYRTPDYYHLPLVTGSDGAKLSKRDNAVSLQAGRNLIRDRGGLLVDALRFLGQTPPEGLRQAEPQEIFNWGLSHFRIDRIPRESAPFTLEV